jgi:hypothetical protein
MARGLSGNSARLSWPEIDDPLFLAYNGHNGSELLMGCQRHKTVLGEEKE